MYLMLLYHAGINAHESIIRTVSITLYTLRCYCTYLTLKMTAAPVHRCESCNVQQFNVEREWEVLWHTPKIS